MTVVLGAIADDFTGATDLANTLRQQGMRATQVIGVPQPDDPPPDAEAVVVALKSRTAPVAEAVAQSLAALDWLLAQGARQIVFKYCSTFDSTPQGNIGPVADALLDRLGEDLAIICPAFPANGRTIYQGYLFVGAQLLSESPMKDHPLTPMRDASLLRLMGAQTARPVALAAHHVVAQGSEALAAKFEALRRDGAGYAVVDALTEADLFAIGAACAGRGLITGGSGIAMGLPENFHRQGLSGAPSPVPERPSTGAAVALAGSCSEATRAQIAWAEARWPVHKLDPDALAAGKAEVAKAVDWAAERLGDHPILIYASADPAEVAAVQERYGRARAGAMIEAAFGRIAQLLVARGAKRLIVAGGETSGAVVSALGVRTLEIGAEIAPGVPWTLSRSEPAVALALKSGNFGGPDFFGAALGEPK